MARILLPPFLSSGDNVAPDGWRSWESVMVQRFEWLSRRSDDDAPQAIRDPFTLLETEAVALLTRLDRIEPFALHETMVPAAGLSPTALARIERFLLLGRRTLRRRVLHYLAWLRSGAGASSPAAAQRAFVILRMEFNDVLSQFDLFSEVVTQRSEHGTGVWLAGLDVAAADALRVPLPGFRAPAVVCYLDRGPGAAIRRARTRLPGGVENPVAIVRVPRERMIGSGIASSLMHEVGHQGAALLCLVESLRSEVRLRREQAAPADRVAWSFWDRWISEIVADCWSVGYVGVSATLGLMQVVSLPRAFVFRVGMDDPHPPPWVRVQLSAAMGEALYPHPQWRRLVALWTQLYPLTGVPPARRFLFDRLRATMPDLVDLLVGHRSEELRGRPLASLLPLQGRQPHELSGVYASWRRNPTAVLRTPPTLAFAVIGQAKADGTLAPRDEGKLISRLLRHWALDRTLRQGDPTRSRPAQAARARLAPVRGGSRSGVPARHRTALGTPG